MLRKIPSNFKIFSCFTICFLVLFFLYRLCWCVVFSSKFSSVSASEIVLAFLVGIRFDVSVCAILLGPFWILSAVYPLNRFKVYTLLWGLFPIFLFFYASAFLIGDTLYFGETNKHLGYEGFVFLGSEFWIIFKSFFAGHTILAIVSCASIGILSPLTILKYIQKKPYTFRPAQKKSELLQLLILPPILFLLVRGGTQSRPLRPSDAMISETPIVNQLVLNGIFTSVMDIKNQSIPNNLKLSYPDAIDSVRKEIEYPGAKFVSEEYPLLRETEETNPGKPPNIVLVLLESWTGKYAYSNGQPLPEGKRIAPHFENLIREGTYFSSFFASGGRTTNGLLSTLTGIPDGPGLTSVRTPQILSRFGGLGTILKSVGYDTLFVHGGDVNFDNMLFLFDHWGFDTILGQEYFDSLKKYKPGPWGYYDGDLLNELHEILINREKPFLAVTLTLTTHYPYKVPSEEHEVFPPNEEEAEYFNVYRYSDWAVHSFLEKAKKAPYFKDTVFIFVGDHTHHRNLDYFEDRNIPFLIYAPGRIPARIDPRISSQLDVIPTVLGIVGKKVRFSAMGRDLLDKRISGGVAYFAFGNFIGWIEGNWIFYSLTDKVRISPFSINPRIGETEECKTDPDKCEAYHLKAKSFWNLSYELMSRNLIYPLKNTNTK
ncbi:LTA synthase family protein [Leptospira santarosai]|uniref:LTA synthase family protein n=1 Tax=Leptospira santarosai TaxID=28183 RepID=UPI00062D931D|nr:LTA synthase family protein [Leptospira santarosai]AVV79502.1 Alkaline phosphatase [Leptospira santarosai]MDI7166308.1 LTA synthase family protein [Leptospira santarosai]ONF84705.1 alkaline phosphatase [Leptospira santarosai serovar Grippotyphosa]